MRLSSESPTSFIQKFSKILAGEDSVGWNDVSTIVPQVVTIYTKKCQKSDSCADWGEIRVFLTRLASRGPDCSISMICAQALLHFGTPGRLAAINIFGSSRWPEQDVRLFLDSMDAQDKLLLMHHVLRHECRVGRHVSTWVRAHLVDIAGYDPAQVYAFCVELGQDREHPAFVLREHYLKQERFLSWFKGFFSQPVLPSEKERMVYVGRALNDPELMLVLAGHFSELPIKAQMVFCKIAAEVFPCGDDRLVPILCKGMRTMDERVFFACLRCLLDLAWPKVDTLLSLLVRKRSDLAVQLRLFALFLSPPQFDTFCKSVPAGGISAVYRSMLAGVVRIDPDFIRSVCKHARDFALPPAFLKVCEDSILSCSTSQVPACPLWKEHDPSDRRKVSITDKIVSFFSKKQVTFHDALHRYASLEDCRFTGSVLEDEVITKRRIKGVRFLNCFFQRTVFDGVRFLDTDFAGTQIGECEFRACTFSRCNFTNSMFKNSKMLGCRFEFIDARRLALARCRFMKNTWLESILTNAFFNECFLQREKFGGCSCAKSVWTSCVLTSCSFEGCDFSRAIFSRTRWYGVENLCVCFVETVFRSLVMRNTLTQESLLVSCFFGRLDTLDPVFLKARQEKIFWNSLLEIPEPSALPADIDHVSVLAVLRQWRLTYAMRDTECYMLGNNTRRRLLAMEKFNMAQDNFFRLLPCLLHSSRFDEYKKMQGIPECRIQEFDPDYTQAKLLDETFPYIEERPRMGVQSEILHIAALFTIGSIGTIAQNKSSDIDVWVCLAESLPEESPLRSQLVIKCDAISEWAQEEYGLEVHFFVMTLEEIRANNFGMLSREGSGSAQALLLKEEFYRTALLVAGQEPRWWVLPPLNEGEEQGISVLPGYIYGKDKVCDLGPLEKIPKEEFFGASLWQIVKFVKNPYKSLLKLALLEKYALQGASPKTLISEIIKRNLLKRMREVHQIDPYGLLYRELLLLYKGLKDKEASNLLRESFHFKIRMQEIDFSLGYPRREEEQSVLFFYFQSKRITEDNVRALGKQWTIAKTLEMGEAMNTFMLSTYRRIQDNVSAAGNKVAIKPEEMTILGRTISAFFGQESGKVRRIFFLDPKGMGYQELYFFCEKGPGGTKVFAVKGRRWNEQGPLEHMEVVRRGSTPISLAAWLVINGLHGSATLVSGNSSLAPVSVIYLQGLLTSILETFPPDRVFAVNQEDMLEEKRVRKVLCVLNYEAGKEDRVPESVDILYATTWGELFWMTISSPSVSIRSDLVGFLTRILPCPLHREAEFFQFRPVSGRTIPLKHY